MVGSVELSVACTNMVDLYLDSEHEDAIRNLALTGDKEGDLVGYAREALSEWKFKIFSSSFHDGWNVIQDWILRLKASTVSPHPTIIQMDWTFKRTEECFWISMLPEEMWVLCLSVNHELFTDCFTLFFFFFDIDTFRLVDAWVSSPLCNPQSSTGPSLPSTRYSQCAEGSEWKNLHH